MPKLVVTPSISSRLTPAQLLRVREMAAAYELHYLEAASLTPALMRDTEILFGTPAPELLAEAPGLKWHHLPSAGIEPYGDLRLYANRNVILTNASGVYGRVMAEHMLSMVLALYRHLPFYARRQPDGGWTRHEDMRELGGETVLILGLGDLGQNAARVFSAMGCRVWGIRKSFIHIPEHVEQVFPLQQLPQLLPQVQVVINCLPSTRDTTLLFNAETFARMRPEAVLVNVGRGSAVDQDALVEALRHKQLWAAALDVTVPEPLPASHPLWQMDTVLITPHCSAASPLTFDRNSDLFLRQLRLYLSGKQLQNRVDFFAGY